MSHRECRAIHVFDFSGSFSCVLNGFSFGCFLLAAEVSCPPKTLPRADVSYTLLSCCAPETGESKCAVGDDALE